MTKRDVLALGALAAIVGLFCGRLLFSGLILPRGDTFAYFYPYWAFRHAALAEGTLPLWNPHLFMGVPFLANSQAGVLYPFNWPLTPLGAPTAVAISAGFHLLWAALGAYLFGRRGLGLSPLAALITGVVFAFGGSLLGKVEQINQLQGLAWLPWILWFWREATTNRPKAVLLMAVAFAMQLLAGHTQTVFISGVGVGLWAAWWTFVRWQEGPRSLPKLVWPLAAVAAGSGVALALAAAQILPTLELTGLSSRSGGLTALEAVSFSFRPQLIGRGLLPGFAAPSLFSEYLGYVGAAALVTAILGLILTYKDRRVQGLALLAGAGLFLALGAYNPIYWFLVNLVPGFDLFRAPARWLILWGVAMAGLAGFGVEALRSATQSMRVPVWLPFGIVFALGAAAFLAPTVAAEVPGATAPILREVLLWLAFLIGASALAVSARQSPQVISTALAGLIVVELFVASRWLPFNDLSHPAAWSSQRPAISTLLALNGGDAGGRFLSLSDTFFDPGDLPEIEAAYGPTLDDRALFDYIVATKQKEIIAPNLPMAWGIPAVDGYDGGVLPTRDYVRFTGLFLAEGDLSSDGRLRENLDAVPPRDWLRATNTQWIITDKVFDAWVDGIYHDLQFPTRVAVGGLVAEGQPVRPFEANALSLIGHLEGPGLVQDETEVGIVRVFPVSGDPIEMRLIVGQHIAAGRRSVPHSLPPVTGSFTPGDPDLIDSVARLVWGEPQPIAAVTVEALPGYGGEIVVKGLTLVDERSGAFQPMQVGAGIRLAHSGDVKIYENLEALPRAYVTCAPRRVLSEEAMWVTLEVVPGEDVILTEGDDSTCQGVHNATITSYEREAVTVTVETDGSGSYLILLDAFYPGWQATVDGQTVPVLRANGIFRAVELPPGSSEVQFTYHSQPLTTGVWVSGFGLFALAVGLIVRWPGANRPDATP